MARVFTDGAETGDISFWSSGSPTASSVSPISGSYHYNIATNNNPVKAFTAVSEGYWRFRVSFNGSPNIRFRNSTTDLLTLTFDNTLNRINLTGAVTGNTGADSIINNTSTLVEVYYKIADANGVVTIRINGIEKFTFTGDTKPGTATTIDNIYIVAGSGASILVDDIAMNDTSGSTDNGWCGDGKVVALLPNAAGDSTQWTPSTGSNYQCVDELPPSDTDYVSASGTGFIDNYNLTSYTLSGTESVGRVWVYARAKDTLAAGTLNLGLRTNSTNYTVGKVLGTSFALISTSGWALNPNTGVAWTQSDLDNLQSTIGMP